MKRRLSHLKGCRQKKAKTVCSVQPTFNIPGLEKIIHSSNHSQKVIWITFVFLFYGLCSYQLVDRITFYFNAPVALDFSIERMTSVELPSVAVCPSFGINILLYKYWRINKVPLEDVLFAENNITLDDIWNVSSNLMNKITPRGSCSEAEANKERKPYDQSLGKCGSDLKMNKDPFPTFWGNCIRITPATRLSYRGAWTYISFHVQKYLEVFHIDKKAFDKNPISVEDFTRHFHDLENQILFMPHLRHVLPTHEITKQSYTVSLGSKVVVNFLLKKFVFLNTKKNPCVDEKVSTQCKESCLENRLLESVNCRLPYMRNILRKPCESLSDAYDVQITVDRVYKDFDNCNCPRPCNETVISFTSDYQAGADGVAIFSLNFPDNAIQIVTERFVYPFPALLSDIGGNLGFCVGLSLFSFVELIVSALQPIFLWLKKKYTKNRCWQEETLHMSVVRNISDHANC